MFGMVREIFMMTRSVRTVDQGRFGFICHMEGVVYVYLFSSLVFFQAVNEDFPVEQDLGGYW